MKERLLLTPEDVKDALERFCLEAKLPYEKERHVVFLDDVRDWTLGLA